MQGSYFSFSATQHSVLKPHSKAASPTWNTTCLLCTQTCSKSQLLRQPRLQTDSAEPDRSKALVIYYLWALLLGTFARRRVSVTKKCPTYSTQAVLNLQQTNSFCPQPVSGSDLSIQLSVAEISVRFKQGLNSSQWKMKIGISQLP